MPEIEITAMTFGPYGVGRLDGKTVMAPNCVPGDRLEVAIESERRDYLLARPIAVIRPGPDRRTPPCPFLPRCGGCDWQAIAYPAQVRLKGEIIAAELARRGQPPSVIGRVLGANFQRVLGDIWGTTSTPLA